VTLLAGVSRRTFWFVLAFGSWGSIRPPDGDKRALASRSIKGAWRHDDRDDDEDTLRGG